MPSRLHVPPRPLAAVAMVRDPTPFRSNLFSLFLREKTNRAAVRRPERKLCLVGILQHASVSRVERAQPQALFSFCNCDESDIAAVRRDGAAKAAELRLIGRGDFELSESGARLSTMERPSDQAENSAPEAHRPTTAKSTLSSVSRAETGVGDSVTNFSSSAMSRADCQRSSGSFARQVLTMRSSAGGMRESILASGGGSVFIIAAIRLACEFPAKAFRLRKHFEKYAAKGEDVGPVIGFFAFKLLGRHIGQCS